MCGGVTPNRTQIIGTLGAKLTQQTTQKSKQTNLERFYLTNPTNTPPTNPPNPIAAILKPFKRFFCFALLSSDLKLDSSLDAF
jgi:hypothetical protein